MRVGPQPKRCDVALPATWQHAIAAGRVPGYLTLRTVDDAGNAYAVQTLGTTSQLVQILPDRTVRAIYRAGAGSHIDDVQVDGDWAVMAIVVGGNQNSHGGEARGRPSGIEAIRIGAREAVTILPGSAMEIRAEPALASRLIDDASLVRRIALIKKAGRSLPPASASFCDVLVERLREAEKSGA